MGNVRQIKFQRCEQSDEAGKPVQMKGREDVERGRIEKRETLTLDI
jgi:hypothetical protein